MSPSRILSKVTFIIKRVVKLLQEEIKQSNFFQLNCKKSRALEYVFF
jgi:hypothetical protein